MLALNYWIWKNTEKTIIFKPIVADLLIPGFLTKVHKITTNLMIELLLKSCAQLNWILSIHTSDEGAIQSIFEMIFPIYHSCIKLECID